MSDSFKHLDSVLALNDSLEAEKRIKKSDDYKTFSENLKAVTQNFKVAIETQSISGMIGNERLMLKFTLENEANSSQEIQSLTAAWTQLKSCARAFNHLASKPEMYKESSQEMFAPKDMKDGLPLDGARKFFKSHKARLNNFMKASVDYHKKQLLTRRLESLKTLEKCYIELQEKAMGVDG